MLWVKSYLRRLFILDLEDLLFFGFIIIFILNFHVDLNRLIVNKQGKFHQMLISKY